MGDTTRPPSHDTTWDPTWGPEPTAADVVDGDTMIRFLHRTIDRIIDTTLEQSREGTA